jgi:hypothetical protein
MPRGPGSDPESKMLKRLTLFPLASVETEPDILLEVTTLRPLMILG